MNGTFEQKTQYNNRHKKPFTKPLWIGGLFFVLIGFLFILNLILAVIDSSEGWFLAFSMLPPGLVSIALAIKLFYRINKDLKAYRSVKCKSSTS